MGLTTGDSLRLQEIREKNRGRAFLIMEKPTVWIYTDEYDLAGVVFSRVDGVAGAIDSFQQSEDIDQTLSDLILQVKAKHDIGWVAIQPILPTGSGIESNSNFVFQELRSSKICETRLLPENVTFGQARLARAKGLKDGILTESRYRGQRKLIERLKQADSKNPPNALLWAYLQAVWDIVRLNHMAKPIEIPTRIRNQIYL